MKQRLLLYLTSETDRTRNAVAATLSWAAQAAGWLFEVYYDGFHLGEHYGGGDPLSLPEGYANGGTVAGGHHFESLYEVLLRFECVAVTNGRVLFTQALDEFEIRRLQVSDPVETYQRIFAILGVPLPESATVVDSQPRPNLVGVDAYCYPEIVEKQTLAFEIDQVDGPCLSALARSGTRTIQTVWVDSERVLDLQHAAQVAGISVEMSPVGEVSATDTYARLTERMARRWLTQYTGGWLLADPLTVSAWLPEAARARRLAIYGQPQRDIVNALAPELAATPTAVLGRQYEDGDFFRLSTLGVAFQLIDPNRPPFPVRRRAIVSRGVPRDVAVSAGVNSDEQVEQEPDDTTLRTWARDGRVLTSLIFWTGMLREVENVPRLVDLVALTRMKGAVALTIPALEYAMDGSLQLLNVPVARGGVFPHLEVMLASSGIGATIESLMPVTSLARHLATASEALAQLRLPAALQPSGWWATMDPDMLPTSAPRLPISARVSIHPPYLRLRYSSTRDPESATGSGHGELNSKALSTKPTSRTVKSRLGDWARAHSLRDMLDPYRPYEFYAPGPLRADMVEAARSAGLRYMFSKAAFGAPPRVLYQDPQFIALNYTVGHWDGWTPFETINSVRDLQQAERRLLGERKPGWIVGTLDSCLWAFTGPIWRRSPGLHAIADFLAHGGASGQLINVTPNVVARYARLLGDIGTASTPLQSTSTLHSEVATCK